MPERNIAVFGASGFVGSALCERLHFEGRADFVPFIHSPGNAARLSRLGLPLRMADLMEREQLREATAGCKVIVNCSRGARQLMLKGLENLIWAARANHVERFIHVGSMAIYGDDPVPESATEQCPPSPHARAYGQMKQKQDEMIFELHRSGLPSYIFCPSNISGPYSPFCLGVTSRLLAGPMPLIDEGRHPTNLVHVDNLVEAILLAARSATAQGAGERYFVNELEPVSWARYYADLAAAAGRSWQYVPVSRQQLLPLLQPEKKEAGVKEHVRILMSREFRETMTKLPVVETLNTWASSTLQALPAGMQSGIRSRLNRPSPIRRAQEGPDLKDPWVMFQARQVFHSPQKAVRQLGFRPVLSYEQGVETSVAWLRFIGLI